MEYGSTGNIPGNEIKRIFDPSSLEVAPEDWESNPVFASIYLDAMSEVVCGNDPKEFTILKVMKTVKANMETGYDFRIYYGPTYCPEGVIQMTPYQMYQFRRYGNVSAFDIQHKAKNTYGWTGSFPSGYNNNQKLVNFSDGLTYSEVLDYCCFDLRAQCGMSDRPLTSLDRLIY